MKISQNLWQSQPEELALKGFKRFGLNPKRNYQIDFFYIDFAFPDKKIGIEINSFRWHKDYEKDKRRWDYLKSKGWKMYFFMAKHIMTNNNIAGAYIYIKEFGEDRQLLKSAKFETYKSFKYILSDTERNKAINEFL